MEAILGSTLKDKDGKEVSTQSLAGDGKAIGLYFSAHWCPPCRMFTPKLAEWYTNFKKGPKGDNLEMIFISSDKDQSSFDEYYKTMPWLCLPYDLRDKKSEISGKFHVSGIPMLLFLDAQTGEVITKNGRAKVTEDPTGENFPWRPVPVSTLLGGKARGKSGDVQLSEALKGKVVGLYFSAHWCPPCKAFTPKLIETYNKLKEANKNFEVIFVSWDKSEEEFNSYYETMPWLAIPPSDKRTRSGLDAHFEIDGIPTFVLLNENLEVITSNGRGAVSGDPEGKDFPWYPKPLNELTVDTASDINEKPCLVYLSGDSSEVSEKAKTEMQPVAEAYKKEVKEKKDLPDLQFFYEGDDSEDLPDSLRQFLNLAKTGPALILINISEGKKYVSEDRDVAATVKAFKEKSLQMKGLRD